MHGAPDHDSQCFSDNPAAHSHLVLNTISSQTSFDRLFILLTVVKTIWMEETDSVHRWALYTIVDLRNV